MKKPCSQGKSSAYLRRPEPRKHDLLRSHGPDGEPLEGTHEGPVGVLLSMHWKPRLRWATGAPYVQGASVE